MKDYFKGQYINISNKARKNLVVAIANHILAKRDKLKPVDFHTVVEHGKRGKFTVKVFDEEKYIKWCCFVGYYDTFTSDSQILEHINDHLPRILKGRHFWVKAGLDGKRFFTNKSIKIEP